MNLQVPKDKSTGPTRSEHESLQSLIRRRISLHAPAKGLVLPEKGTRRIMVFTRLLQNSSCLESGYVPKSLSRKKRKTSSLIVLHQGICVGVKTGHDGINA
ncbi:hypothetical protein YC2023_041067 [Brassica napus]